MEIDQPRPIIWNEREYKLAMIIQTSIQFIQDNIIKWRSMDLWECSTNFLIDQSIPGMMVGKEKKEKITSVKVNKNKGKQITDMKNEDCNETTEYTWK